MTRNSNRRDASFSVEMSFLMHGVTGIITPDSSYPSSRVGPRGKAHLKAHLGPKARR
jgi:hypothetical protein